MSRRAIWLFIAVVSIVLVGAAPANAATCTWDQDQGPADWGDAGNWNCGVVPNGDDDVVISDGLSVVQLAGQAESANSVTLTNFGRLRLGGGTLAIGAGGLTGGRGFIEQAGFVTVAGPWTHSADELTIADGANVTFNGSASLTGGELALDDTPPTGADDPIATFNGALTIGDGVTVSGEGAQETDRPLRIGATGSVTARSATINVLTRNAGTFTVASNETLFVPTPIFEQVAGGTTTLESGGVFDGDIRLNGGTLTGQGTVFDGVLVDGGTVDAPSSGTLTIGGMTQQSGQTVVGPGEALSIDKSGVDQLGGTATVSAGGTLTVSPVAQSWRLEGGTMLLNGTLDGRLFMNRGSTGTLAGGGAVTLDSTLREGTIAPGASAGTLTFEQDLLVDDGATLAIEIGGSAPGSEFDRIVVGGEANLDAHVQVTLINAFTPPGDSQYQFLTSGSRVGTFRSVTGAGNFTLDYPGAPSFGARLVAPPAGPPPANTSPPFITGTPAGQQIITCNPGTWNPDGTPTKFDWYRVTDQGPVFITGAVPDSNSLNNNFMSSWVGPGVTIFCRVTMTNGGGSTTADSAPVTILSPPANTSPPFITGQQFLTCNPGTWNPGGTPTKFEWFRINGPNVEYITEAVPDANSLNNLFSSSWVPPGTQVRCRVTMTNDAGSAAAESALVTVGGPQQPNPQPVPPSPEDLLADASPAAVAKAFGMPSARRCLRIRKLKISLKIPAGVTVKSASLVVRRKKIKLRRVGGRLKGIVDLRGLPSGRLTIVLKVTTTSGKTLRGKRVYRKCGA